MKFDTTRAMRTTAALTASPVQEGDRGISWAEFVAESLKNSGWIVQSGELTGSASAWAARSALSYIFIWAWATFLMILLHFRVNWPWFVLAFGLLVGWIVLADQGFHRLLKRLPPLRKARLVIARREAPVDPPARLVIQAALGPIAGPLGMRPKDCWLFHLSVAGAGAAILAWHMVVGEGFPNSWFSAENGAWGLCVLAWLSLPFVAVLRCSLAARTRVSAGSCDAPALSVLLELARIWPGNRSGRLETVLVAVGGQEFDHVGDRALRRIVGKWPPKPTLIISLAAPGLGRKLLIRDSSDDGVVVQAAGKLWIPHQWAKTSEIPTRIKPLSGVAHGKVVWIEGAWFEDPLPDLDAGALARTAQLIDEVALLWAKHHAPPASEEVADRTASRSSQNPG
ncbi:MAG: hypothetical protein ACP5XB_12745 [Isosphaeraceae bacterium]